MDDVKKTEQGTRREKRKAPEYPVRARPLDEPVDPKEFAKKTLRDFPRTMRELAK